MHAQYPSLRFHGETYNPGDAKLALSQLLQLTFFGGLVVSLVGRSVLPEPYSKFIESNQMPILGACFLCNIVAGNLLNTGAFEIAFNGEPVWSKMETGRFPQMEELKASLQGVMFPAAGEKLAQ